MKRYGWIFVLILMASLAFAATGTIPVSNAPTGANLTYTNQSGLGIQYNLNQIDFRDVQTAEGSFTQLYVDGYAFTNRTGMPQLPLMRKIIRVPLEANIVPRVTNRQTTMINLASYGINAQVLPRQESVSKSVDSATLPFSINRSFYTGTAWSTEPTVKVEEIGMMRGARLVAIDYTPVQYNPSTGQIEVTISADVVVSYVNADWNATDELYRRYYSPVFETALSQTVFNYEEQRISLDRYPLSMLIITPSMFTATLQPFVDWKTAQGYNVNVVTTLVAGTTTNAIKAYIQNIWNNSTATNPAPSYLIIVGDVQNIPAFVGSTDSGHVTDLTYVRLQGTDYVPEMYFGRMSATTTAQLQAILDKTLQYEQFTMPDPSYLENTVLIAGQDPTYGPLHGDGQINYGATNYFGPDWVSGPGYGVYNIKNKKFNYNISANAEAAIIAKMNSGLSFINYTAHGGETSWSDPTLTVANVNSLTNLNKYFVAVGNCCLTSAFDTGECLGEAFLRASNKGAVGYIGGTNSSYWDEDYYWAVGYKPPVVANGSPYIANRIGVYDGLFHSHNEAFADWCGTMGAMNFMGNLAVTASNSGRVNYYWEIYSIMGDPSLVPYIGLPTEINATYQTNVYLGLGSMQVSTDPFTYVALSMNGQLMGVGLSSATGDLTLNFTPFTQPGTAQLVMTRAMCRPLIADITVIAGTTDYVLCSTMTVNDGGNSIAEAGETLYLNSTFNNVGTVAATNVNATLTSTCPYVTILNGTVHVGNVDPQQTINLAQAFQILVSAGIPDQEEVVFNIQCTSDSDNITDSAKNLVVNAPNIIFGNTTMADGDNDGIMESGETINVNLNLINNGHMNAASGTLNVVLSFNNATLSQNTFTLPGFSIGVNIPLSFQVILGQGIADGTVVPLGLALTVGDQLVNSSVAIPVGLVMETFEYPTLADSPFPWVNTSPTPWLLSSGTGNFHSGEKSVRSGPILHNGLTELSLPMNVGAAGNISFWKKLSSESGYDYLKFYIDGVENGSWSGSYTSWTQHTYPVTVGQHIFKWAYSKDGSQSSGSDCAWLDDIIFPLSGSATVPIYYCTTTQLNFDDVPADEVVSRDFALRNLGMSAMTGTISVPSAFELLENGSTVSSPYNYSVAPTSNNIYTLRIVPEAGLNVDDVVSITTNDIMNPTETIAVHLNTVPNDDNTIPTVTKLEGNYPNPFNPVTTIRFALKASGRTTLNVYNLKGQLVRSLVNGEVKAGNHSIAWNGQDDKGKSVSSGVYLYRLQTTGYSKTQKMMLMK